jgi:hypothetical protein
MDKAARRAAKTAWRERAPGWAVVSVRIGARRWVRLTPDAGALENRLGFMLRQGGGYGLAPGMAAAYGAGGALAVTEVERLDAALSVFARERVGTERLAHWAQALDAAVF